MRGNQEHNQDKMDGFRGVASYCPKLFQGNMRGGGFVLFFGSFSSSLNVTSTAFNEAMVSATGVH